MSRTENGFQVESGAESGLSPHRGRVLPLRPLAVCASLTVQAYVNLALTPCIELASRLPLPHWGAARTPMERPIFRAVIVGAGPAGLTAAYELSKQHASVVVLESDPQYVGGISRTVKFKGFRFDIGGHRFFSKSREVEDLWTEIAGDLMLERPRASSIYY